MTAFALLKSLHIGCAFLSVSSFFLRGYWMATGHALLQHRLAKVLPHIIDTLLLGSAIGMLMSWNVSPLALPWLTAKIIALLVYIGLGLVALRFGRTRLTKMTAWCLALVTAGYIISVAYAKSPQGIFVLAG